MYLLLSKGFLLKTLCRRKNHNECTVDNGEEQKGNHSSRSLKYEYDLCLVDAK